MKIVVTAEGNDLNAPTSSRFGRCPTFIIVETETMAFEAQPNPALSASGGAGTQAAQFIAKQGVEGVLTGNVGPNAMEVLQAADIPVYLIDGGTVQQVVETYKAGQLEQAAGANVRQHSGMTRRNRPPATAPSRREEISALQAKAADLRRQLVEVLTAIEKLEKEN